MKPAVQLTSPTSSTHLKRRFASGRAKAFALTWLAYCVTTACRLGFAVVKGPLTGPPGWQPFAAADGELQLGWVDFSFMMAYTLGMPIMGRLADSGRGMRVWLLCLSLVFSSVALAIFGCGRAWEMHSLSFFIVLAFVCGWAQSTAYPCATGVLAQWFSSAHMGKLMGVWSSSTPVGGMVGKALGSVGLELGGWSWVFFVLSAVGAATGIVTILFLIEDPHDIGLQRPDEADGGPCSPPDSVFESEEVGTADSHAEGGSKSGGLPLAMVLSVPYLFSYCAAVFFAKMLYYALINWLPVFLQQEAGLRAADANSLASFFDLGCLIATALAGWLSDWLGSRGVVCAGMQFLGCPLLLAYAAVGPQLGYAGNVVALLFLGAAIGTSYCLITTVVAINLARHPVLRGSTRATSFIVGIVDSSGSLGAALQGPIVGFAASTAGGWSAVFSAFVIACLCAALLLVAPARAEWSSARRGQPLLPKASGCE